VEALKKLKEAEGEERRQIELAAKMAKESDM
jgi:hypothetical protein